MVASIVRAGALVTLVLTACHPVALTVPPARVAGQHAHRRPAVELVESTTYAMRDDGQGGLSHVDRMDAQIAEHFDVPPITQCPLLVTFDDTEVQMSPAAADAASFELGRASSCDAADWPAAETPWLAWDRDGSGAIEGGHELFGTATRVAPGRWADDGFAALSTLDADDNGRIDANDPPYAALRLWTDRDGDRRSSADELISLRDAGIDALPLGYVVDERCDARGNCLRERAEITMHADAPHRSATLIDVHARCE